MVLADDNGISMHASHFPDYADIPFRRVAYVASAIVIVAVASSFFIQVELKKDVPCEIVAAGELKIPGVNGLVSKVLVNVHERVKVGTPLFQVERDMSLTSDGRTQREFVRSEREDRISTIENQVDKRRDEAQTRIEGLQSVLDNRSDELRLIADEIKEAGRQIDEGKKTLDRLQSVSDYVVAERIEQARSELAQRRINLSQRLARQREISSEIALARINLKEARATLATTEIQGRRDIKNVSADYEKNQPSIVVSSPVDGVVSFSQVLYGRNLSDQEVAMAVSSDGHRHLQAALRIPSRQRGFIKEGQIVRLKFDAFPYARFGTYAVRIDAISHDTMTMAERPEDSPNSASATAGGSYVAYASVPEDAFVSRGGRHEILPGMRATASVVVERRTIAEWVLAPLFEIWRG